MKKLITALLCFSLMACSQPLHTNGKTYEPYGLLNADAKKNENVCYQYSVGGVILSIILIETVFVPVYIFGWDVFEPFKEKKDGKCN